MLAFGSHAGYDGFVTASPGQTVTAGPLTARLAYSRPFRASDFASPDACGWKQVTPLREYVTRIGELHVMLQLLGFSFSQSNGFIKTINEGWDDHGPDATWVCGNKVPMQNSSVFYDGSM